MRAVAKSEGKSALYDGRWRERDPADAPEGVNPVIRLKASLEGRTVANDAIQGSVSVANTQMDDMVLLRADGTPTYMLAVVVDDHDMDITHVIRGDDHLTNTFRQLQIYTALGWCPPIFAHMPLLHDSTGAKFSKRDGAPGIMTYKEMGFLSEAINNYLLRLGWAHGNEEIISREKAIKWFDLKDVGRSAARFDFGKLTSLNSHYLKKTDDEQLISLIMPIINKMLHGNVADGNYERLKQGMPGLKNRAKNIVELAENALFYVHCRPILIDDNAAKILDSSSIAVLDKLRQMLAKTTDWSYSSLEDTINKFAQETDIKLGKIAQPLRAALTGKTISPGVFEVLTVLGKDQSLGRIDDVLVNT